MATFADNNTYDEVNLQASSFDDGAIVAARGARDEALHEGQREIGVRHLLIGLLSDHQSVASQIVAALGAAPEQLVQAARAIAVVTPAPSTISPAPVGNAPVVTWAPEILKVYELAVDEVLRAPSVERSVDTAYLLLGVLRLDPQELELLLKQRGVTVENVRRLLRSRRSQP